MIALHWNAATTGSPTLRQILEARETLKRLEEEFKADKEAWEKSKAVEVKKASAGEKAK